MYTNITVSHVYKVEILCINVHKHNFCSHMYFRLQALAALSMWVQLLQSSIISKAMAAFTYSVSTMLVDISHSLVLILVLTLAFGSALSILEGRHF